MNRSSEATIPAGNRYRSMMAIARRQSDPELERLLRERLRGSVSRREAEGGGCEIIDLESPDRPKRGDGSNPAGAFWKDQTFWTDLLQFMAFLSAALVSFLHFLHLVILRFPILSG